MARKRNRAAPKVGKGATLKPERVQPKVAAPAYGGSKPKRRPGKKAAAPPAGTLKPERVQKGPAARDRKRPPAR